MVLIVVLVIGEELRGRPGVADVNSLVQSSTTCMCSCTFCSPLLWFLSVFGHMAKEYGNPWLNLPSPEGPSSLTTPSYMCGFFSVPLTPLLKPPAVTT